MNETISMTREEFNELWNRLITFRNAAGAYVPPNAAEVFAAWADVNDLLASIREANTRAEYVVSGQLSLLDWLMGGAS